MAPPDLSAVEQLRLQERGVEIKRTDAPRQTPSMRIAMEDLHLEALVVLYPGPVRYALTERIEAVPLAALAEDPSGLFPWRRRARRPG